MRCGMGTLGENLTRLRALVGNEVGAGKEA
jgi:hypothetical protein